MRTLVALVVFQAFFELDGKEALLVAWKMTRKELHPPHRVLNAKRVKCQGDDAASDAPSGCSSSSEPVEEPPGVAAAVDYVFSNSELERVLF